MQSVKVISIATAVPPHAIEQGDAATVAGQSGGPSCRLEQIKARGLRPRRSQHQQRQSVRSSYLKPEDLMAPWIAAMAAALLAV
jgi:hypothetical protein